ncbi:MAG: PKD domain-containing protein [Desulfobacterales bacterium]|jgi:hypothetical protein
MKRATFSLTLMSVLLMLLYGCSGGSSGGSIDGSNSSVENLQPIADAGDDQTAPVGGLASLDGSGSYDPDENYPLTYDWQLVSKPQGSTAVLSQFVSADDSGGSHVFIEVDVNGDYVIQLVVTDSLGLASEPASIVVSTHNSAPVANAGEDQHFENEGIEIQLDGSQSFDPDGDPITYAWAITNRPPFSGATLSNPNGAQPTFVADMLGTYIMELVVTDDLGASSVPDEVVVTSGNVKPVADAGGNQVVIVGQTVFLDGSGSYDVNLDPLTYSWDMVSQPKGSFAVLSDPLVVDPNFVPDIQGLYLVSLVVNDDLLDSDPSNATILAIDADKIDDFIEALMKAIIEINGLDRSDINNYNNKNALTNKIISVILNYLKGNYGLSMLDKLRDDIAGKFDGCALDDPATQDQNDWIMNCLAQDKVYPHLELAISILDDILSAQ